MQNSTYRERDYAQENEDGVYGSNIGILLQHLGSSRKPQLHLITHLSHIGHAVEAIEAGESRQGSGIQHVSWVFAELDIARKMSRQADVTMDDPLGTLELVETSIVAYGRGMENSGVNRGDDIRIANMCRAPGTEVAEGMECKGVRKSSNSLANLKQASIAKCLLRRDQHL